MSKSVAKVWTFASSSDPDKTYETLLFGDGTTSCNCMAWTRRVAMDGSRSCRHTRSVDMGRADVEALSSHDYSGATPLKMKDSQISKPQPPTRKDTNASKKKAGSPSPTGYGKRRIIM